MNPDEAFAKMQEQRIANEQAETRQAAERADRERAEMEARRSAREWLESGIERAHAPRRGAGCRRTLTPAA